MKKPALAQSLVLLLNQRNALQRLEGAIQGFQDTLLMPQQLLEMIEIEPTPEDAMNLALSEVEPTECYLLSPGTLVAGTQLEALRQARSALIHLALFMATDEAEKLSPNTQQIHHTMIVALACAFGLSEDDLNTEMNAYLEMLRSGELVRAAKAHAESVGAELRFTEIGGQELPVPPAGEDEEDRLRGIALSHATLDDWEPQGQPQ